MRSPAGTGVGQSRVGSTRPAVWRSCCSVWAAQALVDPAPQGAVRRPSYPCPHDPFFVLPMVVDGSAHDDSTVVFLLAQSLLERQKEEEQLQAQAREPRVLVSLRPGLRVVVCGSRPKLNVVSRARWSRCGGGCGRWLSTPRPCTCTSTKPSSALRILGEGASGVRGLASPGSLLGATWFDSGYMLCVSVRSLSSVFTSFLRGRGPRILRSILRFSCFLHLPCSHLFGVCFAGGVQESGTFLRDDHWLVFRSGR